MSVFVEGLSNGLLIFLIACGLTIILGLLGVANFAHGAFFAVGAYVLYALLGGGTPSVVVFVGGIAVAAVAGAVLGLVSERWIFRPLSEMPAAMSLIGTFALLLVLQGATQSIWGVDPRAQAKPAVIAGSVVLFGANVPWYSIMVIATGLVIAAGLVIVTRWTRAGHLLAAVAEDREMARLLGIPTARVTAVTFAVGLALAAVGGALAAPTVSLTPPLAVTFIIPAFAVVITGGFGSLGGSLLAAVGIGIAQSVLATYVPQLADYTVYIVMGVVLLLRPQGLFGSGEFAHA